MYQMDDMPCGEDIDDNEYITKNLIETVTLLCRNNLKYNCELKIQGLLAVTTDYQNVIVIQINEILPKKCSSVGGSHHMGGGGNNMMESNSVPSSMGGVPIMSGLSRGSRTVGRGRFVRRGGAPQGSGTTVRMKVPALAQSHMAARARARQQLQFSTPQKRPPPPQHVSPGYSQSPVLRSPGSMTVRTSQHLKQLPPPPQQQVDPTSPGAMVPYNSSPNIQRTPGRRPPPQLIRPKLEVMENNEEGGTPSKRPVTIKREKQSNQASSDICVLSDEEDYGPPRLKSEVGESPQRKRRMPVLSSEVECEARSSLDVIVQESINEASGCERPASQSRINYVNVKCESAPSVQIETMKDEVDWSAMDQWAAASEQQQHYCNQCGSTFHNKRSLRQHMRNAHPGMGGSNDVDSSVVAMLVDSVVTSPASSSTTIRVGSITNRRGDDDLGEVM